MSDRKELPFLSLDVVIGLLSFEADADQAERGSPAAVTYYIHAHKNADDVENLCPSHSVEVGREDFLAMLEIAKAGVSVGRAALHRSEEET